jgi:hypothetical protein
MRLEHWMVFAAILALLATGLVLACDDDDDDDNDDDTNAGDDDDTAVGDDDDTTPADSACVTAAKLAADAYCASHGLVRDDSRTGLGTSGFECLVYCDYGDFLNDSSCEGGVCICCI